MKVSHCGRGFGPWPSRLPVAVQAAVLALAAVVQQLHLAPQAEAAASILRVGALITQAFNPASRQVFVRDTAPGNDIWPGKLLFRTSLEQDTWKHPTQFADL